MDLPQKYFNPPKKLFELNWKIGGEAGFGIKSAGLMLAKTILRHGYYIFGYDEYPSLIRGGHNSYQLHISELPAHSQKYHISLLVCLNRKTFDAHKDELEPGAIVIFDESNCQIGEEELKPWEAREVKVPLVKFATEIGGDGIMANTVALGASLAILGGEFEILAGVIKDTFVAKGKEIVSQNIKAAKEGFDFAQRYSDLWVGDKLQVKQQLKKIVLTGNEAIALGAIAAGCKFFAAYPMTPTSNILHYLASVGPKKGMVIKHAEDEIAVINMAVGASFAGARSMVATSGGGFCLMVEGYGLAAMTETPVVIVEGMRPGPSTGLPTWTEQGDLHFVLNAAQGEFARVVVAPGDIGEAFNFTFEAFNIAEKYQTPVVILVDKLICESHSSVNRFEVDDLIMERGEILDEEKIANLGKFQRYQVTPSGVSPRTFPGVKGGQFVANSDEHDQSGFSTEDSSIRRAMVEKRLRKMEGIAKDVSYPKVYQDDPQAPLTVISFGSVKMPMLQVLEWLENENVKINYCNLNWLSPFPAAFMADLIGKSKKTLVVENNATGQLAKLIQKETGKKIDEIFLKYDGRPFYPEEIIDKVKGMI